MRKTDLQFWLLVIGLLIAGSLLSFYQYQVLKLPLLEQANAKVWTIEARLQFLPKKDQGARVDFVIPKENKNFFELQESFIAKNYGLTVRDQADNRLAVWSVRRAEGDQTLYYRLVISQRQGQTSPQLASPPQVARINFSGAKRTAAEAFIDPIRSQSADVATFTSSAIKLLNEGGHNSNLLLANEQTPQAKAQVMVDLLALAKIPAYVVQGLMLTPGKAELSVWLASYNDNEWDYYNINTGQPGLPDNVLIWQVGEQPLLTLKGATRPQLDFTISQDQVNALALAQQIGNKNQSYLMQFSLFGLPLATQEVYKILLMIPLGIFIILLLRNLVGITTLGTFMPVLIGLAFRETQLAWGITLFIAITAFGLAIRAYLEHLKLLLVPKLAIILTMVVLLMGFISIICHKLGLTHGLSVALFPMVILTMTIERMSVLWEELGGIAAVKAGVGSLVVAALAYLVMINPLATHIVFTFPGVLLVLMALMLMLGRYRGYRLTELIRFRSFKQH